MESIVFEVLRRISVMSIGAAFCSASILAGEYDGIPRLMNGIVVDGNLEDWKEHVRKGELETAFGKSEQPFLFISGWNDEGFHFAAEVVDEKIRPAIESEGVFDGDRIELFWDVRPRGVGARPALSEGRLIVDYFLVEDEKGSVHLIDDSSDQVAYESGHWRTFPLAGAHNGEVSYNESAIEQTFSVEVAFEGTRVGVGGARASSGGVCDVYIDNAFVGTIDSYGVGVEVHPEIVFESEKLAAGRHMLRLESRPPDLKGLCHLVVCPGDLASQETSWFWNGSQRLDVSNRVVSKLTDSGWIVEGSIPWSSLNKFSASLGCSLGFACSIQNADEKRSVRYSLYESHGESIAYHLENLGAGKEALPDIELTGVDGLRMSDGVYESISRIDPERIVIDADLEDWKGHPFEALGSDSPTEGSFAALSYAGWSEEGLYFAAKVYDDFVSSPSFEFEEMRNQDCLELFLDIRDAPGDSRIGSGGMLYVDHLIIENDRGEISIVEESDPKIEYLEGTWEQENSWGFSGVTAVRNAIIDRSVSVEAVFEGTRIQVAADVYAHRTKNAYDVYIDDEIWGAFSSATDTPWLRSEIVFDSGKLEDGEHRLRIAKRVASGEGVAHLLIRPNGPDGSVALGFNNAGALDLSRYVRAMPTDEGWNVEGFIPVSYLGGLDVVEGKAIRFGSKLYDRDEASSGAPEVLGIERHGSNTTVEWITQYPSRFPKMRLKGYSDPLLVDAYAKEVLMGDRADLEIDVKIPVDYIELGQESPDWFEYSVHGGALRRLKLSPSAGGRFLRARHFESIDSDFGGADRVELSLGFSWKEQEQLTLGVRPKINQAIDHVMSGLPNEYIDSLGEKERGIALMHRECALELVGHLEDRRNRNIEGFHLLPFYEDRAELLRGIEAMLFQAKVWIEDSERFNQESQRYRQVWQSEIDGSWQFFTTQFPSDFEVGKSLPVELNFHPINKSRFSRLNQLLAAFRRGLGNGPVPSERAMIEIGLSGRGNSFDALGDKEFEYVLRWIQEAFPASSDRIVLRGASRGASSAIAFATRNLEIPAFVDLNSPAIAGPYPDLMSRSYDDARIYEVLTGDIGDKALGLKSFPLRISTGDGDEFHYDRAIKLFEMLNDDSGRKRLDIMEGLGHAISRADLPEIEVPAVHEGPAEEFALLQESARYGEAYGVKVWEKRQLWKPFSVKFYSPKAGLKYLATENVESMTIDLSRLLSDNQEVTLLIDSAAFRLKEEELNGTVHLANQGGRWMRVEHFPVNRENEKMPGLEGPIGDIEKEGFLLVYGTANENSTAVLLGRARRIVDHRTGSDFGQWDGGKFRIVADVDVTEDDLKNRNLWLIGNREENIWVDKIMALLDHDVREDGVVIAGREWNGDRLFLELLCRNPLSPNRYAYIEAGQSVESYYSEILENRNVDFAITKFDAIKNDLVARGVFDANWSFGADRSIVWE